MRFSGNNTHLFFQLYLSLREDILLGVYQPGTRLPNIVELHDKYGLSHGTVRRALDLLANEGLIVKIQGAGTFVRDNIGPDMLINPDTSYDELHKVLHTFEVTPISQEWVDAPPQVQAAFSGHEGSLKEGRIFFVKRLLTSMVEPRRRFLADIFIPAWIIAKVGMENPWKGTVHELVDEVAGTKLFKIVQKIRPWICDNESAKLLDLLAGTPIFHRSWFYLDQGNRLLAYTETLTTVETLTNEIVMR